jgi:hypothetical protein
LIAVFAFRNLSRRLERLEEERIPADPPKIIEVVYVKNLQRRLMQLEAVLDL